MRAVALVFRVRELLRLCAVLVWLVAGLGWLVGVRSSLTAFIHSRVRIRAGETERRMNGLCEIVNRRQAGDCVFVCVFTALPTDV